MSSLGIPIPCIVSTRSKKKMVVISASRIVALVADTHPFRETAVLEVVGQLMSLEIHLLAQVLGVECELPITISVEARSPLPTLTRLTLFDFYPKPSSGVLRVYHFFEMPQL